MLRKIARYALPRPGMSPLTQTLSDNRALRPDQNSRDERSRVGSIVSVEWVSCTIVIEIRVIWVSAPHPVSHIVSYTE